jgi:hypothetical protein
MLTKRVVPRSVQHCRMAGTNLTGTGPELDGLQEDTKRAAGVD